VVDWTCPPLVEPPKTGRTRDDVATLPFPVPGDRGGIPMAHWPKTVSGNLFTFGLIVVVVPLMVWFVITLPSWVLLALGVVALAAVALVLWRRRLDAARERAWVGEFSFGDVVRRRKAAEELELATP
jgi:hypothetical protein